LFVQNNLSLSGPWNAFRIVQIYFLTNKKTLPSLAKFFSGSEPPVYENIAYSVICCCSACSLFMRS
jgi:hypothetical protein